MGKLRRAVENAEVVLYDSSEIRVHYDETRDTGEEVVIEFIAGDEILVMSPLDAARLGVALIAVAGVANE